MKHIELTDVKGNRSFMVHPDHIVLIEETPSGTQIWMNALAGNEQGQTFSVTYIVLETREDILKASGAAYEKLYYDSSMNTVRAMIELLPKPWWIRVFLWVKARIKRK